MTKSSLIYLCNAIDENTCLERGITSDSPAATQKVLQMSSALADAGVKTILLSLGRGGQKGTWRWYPARARRFNSKTVLYAPFFDAPVLTHFVTLLGLLPLIYCLKKPTSGTRVVLAYNRLPYYVLGLLLARIFGWHSFLDLEDGEIVGSASLRSRCIAALGRSINQLCDSGAVLASRALASAYPSKNTLCCYGVSGAAGKDRNWQGKVRILLGGTLQHNTGATLLMDAVKKLRSTTDPILKDLEFIVTGKGPMAPELRAFAETPGEPAVKFMGSLPRKEYRELVEEAQVGLCLKLVSSSLCDTTFPSKVIEITSSGLLLLSTQVSDVPWLFKQDEAFFLEDEQPESLANACCWLLKNRSEASEMAKRGQAKAQEKFSARNVGESLKAFLFHR